MSRLQLKLPIQRHRPGTKAHLVEERLVFGGALNYRKKKRPFMKARAVHLVFRSPRLQGTRSLLRQNRAAWVESLLRHRIRKYGVKLYGFSINSNHIHVLAKFAAARLQASFLRDFAGTLALKLKRLFRMDGPVWSARPFSSIVKPGAYRRLLDYIETNRNEAAGLWPYQPRPISALVKFLDRLARVGPAPARENARFSLQP